MTVSTFASEQLANKIRFSKEDLEIIGQRRRIHNQLGFSYQLAFVRLHNRFPQQRPLEIIDDLLTLIGIQFDIPTDLINDYNQRQKTVSEHQEKIRSYLGLIRFSQTDIKLLEKFIFEQACRLEQTHALLAIAKEFLRERSILEPADDTLQRIIQKQRQGAHQYIQQKVNGLLSHKHKRVLDDLLIVGNGVISALQELKQSPNRASPSSLLRLTTKLETITASGILEINLSWLNNNLQRSMARYARRLTATRLRELTEMKRYTTLTCFLQQLYRDITDDMVRMFDKIMNQVYNRSQVALDNYQRSQRKSLRVSLDKFKEIADIILDESIEDSDLRQRIFDRVDKEELTTQTNKIESWLNGKYNNIFSLLVNTRYPYIRQFAPALLEHLELELEDGKENKLMDAIKLLRNMNSSGKRKLPENAPISFMPKALQRTIIDGSGNIEKSSWECALLTVIRDYIKSGNLAVLNSKRYGHLDEFFMPEEKWKCIRKDFFHRAGFPDNANKVSAFLTHRLNQAFDNFLNRLPENSYVQIDESGWRLSRDVVEQTDADDYQNLKELHHHLTTHMRIIKLPQLLVEVDNELRFSRYFMSSIQQEKPDTDNVCEILATIMAHGCNIGSYTMSHLIEGVSYHRIKHISDWFLTDEAQRTALSQVVNAISHLDITQVWGTGQTSSSDGQRFTLRRNLLQQAYSHSFNDFSLEFYSFIADNYAPYYSMPIECTDRDAPYVLDGLLYNESDLALEEHYTDTHGYTEINFSAFAMLGRQFAPRIRGLQKQRIYRIDIDKDYGPLALFVDQTSRTIHLNWICEQWDRMGHFYASLEDGHATASVALKRLNGYSGKNHFYRANRELGRIFKTEHILRYMSDKNLRQRTQRGLLKSEQLHSLARNLNYGQRGKINKRDWLEQRNSSSCLTLILACIIYWQAKEIRRVLLESPSKVDLYPELVEHISPITWDNVILYGEYVIDRSWIRIP